MRLSHIKRFTWGLVALAVMAVGCGSDQAKLNTDSAKVGDRIAHLAQTYRKDGDPHPRIAGTWRVVYRPTGGDARTLHRTWKALPTCIWGACTVRMRSSDRGSVFRFKFDRAIGDYTRSEAEPYDCSYLQSKRLVVSNAYLFTHQTNLRVVASRVVRGHRYATRLGGRDVRRQTRTNKALLAGCPLPDPTVVNHVIAVRVDRP